MIFCTLKTVDKSQDLESVGYGPFHRYKQSQSCFCGGMILVFDLAQLMHD